jgi:DNA-binding response OmpR family regulator
MTHGATDGMRDSSPVVLVVDDNDATRTLFASWLRRAGYIVNEASFGAQALELIARARVDLVLLDVNLPDMSGLDVAQRIKSGRATSSIPVLHASATAIEDSQRSAGLNAGADGYLIEPVDREVLLASVASLLRLYEPRRAAEHLAAQLEQLHQATLLMNAAPTAHELMSFASTGLAGLFSVPAAVLLVRGGIGRMAISTPNDQEPRVIECAVEDIMSLADAVARDEPLRLDFIRRETGAPRSAQGHASRIMTPRGQVVGVVTLLGGALRPEHELMLDHFAQAFAVALENQRLFAVEHQIALTLQRAMLPQRLPEPAALELAARYEAASDTAEIGGDFYEVLELSEHRILLAIGDVMGHSLRAATVMAELRYSLRALASIGMSAAEILRQLDQMVEQHSPMTMATMCIVDVDVLAGRVAITNAGHIPPMLVRGGSAELVAEHGILLGSRIPSARPTVTEPFGPGDVMVLVTDGLLERRGEALSAGLARLAGIRLPATESAQQLADRVLRELGPGEQSQDDVALLVARRVDGGPSMIEAAHHA